MVIYRITNTVNNKVYIGQTVQNLNDRLNHHFRSNPKLPLYKAHLKYGRKSFIIEIIDKAETLEELNDKEVYWIQYYDSTNKKNGYNLMTGGGNKGRHSDISKRKMSESQKKSMTREKKDKISKAARNISDETRRKMSEAKKGKKQSPELIKKRADARRGYKWTEESKRKSSEKQKGRKFTEEHIENMKKAASKKIPHPNSIKALLESNERKKRERNVKQKTENAIKSDVCEIDPP